MHATNNSGGRDKLPLSSRLERSERHQLQLWWLTFLLLLALSIGFAVTSWDSLHTFSQRAEAIGLVILVPLFVIYARGRTQEISELRGVVRGIEQRDSEPPSEKQLDHLFHAISRSQQGYRDLIDSFDDVLISLTLSGEIRAANRSFSNLVGLAFQEIIGKPLSNFVEGANDDASESVKRFMPAFLERRSWAEVVEVRLKGRSTIYHFDCVAHAVMRDETVHGITVMARNITALRQNESRFTEIFETLQEGIYIATPAGAILDVNPALVRMLGYSSKEELLKKTVPEILQSSKDRKRLKESVDQEMLQGSEINLRRRDGHSILCLNTAAAVRDSSGRVVRYHGALMDITERREIEKRLHQQQEFARRLVSNFPDLILVVDRNGQFTFVSPRVHDVLGFLPQEVQELELGQWAHSDDRDTLQGVYRQILNGTTDLSSSEFRVRHKNREWRRIRCNLSPLFNETGKIDGVVISGRDVTDIKRLEEQLIQSEKLAAMGQMLAGVAHELNNPLTAILGVTELLAERPDTDEGAKRQLDLAHRQARRAARIVQNLLEFSQPAAPKKAALDVRSLIERTIQLHEHSLRRNAVEIEFHPPDNLPEVVADGNQLIQVFLNLITNAEQAIREVRSNGRIQIRLGRVGALLTVTVQDDGVGIRPEAILKVFDPFYTTKRPGGGTGLGLSICMAIVKEHGGNIEAETLPAGGSAFTVYLPIAKAEVANITPGLGNSGKSNKLAALSDGTRPKTVLVLDDEESIRMLLAEGLGSRGLKVDCVATLQEALALVAVHPYDALLCDLNLSFGGFAVDGRAAAQEILTAAHFCKPALIYITGEFLGTDAQGRDPNGFRYLQKPFRISDVLAMLQEIPEMTTTLH